LQRMEMLELLVESSELALKALVENKNAEPVRSSTARTRLTLKLSFYDLDLETDPTADGSISTPS